MIKGHPLIQLSLLVIYAGLSQATIKHCSSPGLSRCFCGLMPYLGQQNQYVVNCTDQGFRNASFLQHIPLETQILIFVGNDIPELPWNIFGTGSTPLHIRVIDMSNNKIKEIKGKSYHRVSTVQRLILNHNDISISWKEHHPRVFSNFENLEELHLTNAFADNTAEDLADDLRDIFISSNLTKLRKLHLEQNEITTFTDPRVFCDLTSLLDLHLGDNKLERLSMNIDCLRHLRYIDLERNDFSELSVGEMAALDVLPLRGQNLSVELRDNPLTCGPKVDRLYNWLQKTKVEVKNKSRLKCIRMGCGHGSSTQSVLLSEVNSKSYKGRLGKLGSPATFVPPESSTALALLSLALVLTLCLLVYTNRDPIGSFLRPFMISISRKVHYVNIGKQEGVAQEMDV